MTFDEFQNSLTSSAVREDLSDYLKSLWYDGKGDWNRAHSIIQNIEDRTEKLPGYTLIFIARRETLEMLTTGTAEQIKKDPTSNWKKNGNPL